MTFNKHTILFGLFLVVLIHPLRSQTFQQVYNTLNSSANVEGGTSADVVEHISSVGFGISTVGTSPFGNLFRPYGLFNFYDMTGAPLAFSQVLDNTSNLTGVRGVDVCEASWSTDEIIGVFSNSTPGGVRTIVVCVDETTQGMLWIRVIEDFSPEAIIPARTGFGDGVYICGLDLTSGSPTYGQLVVHGLDGSGSTIWSHAFSLMTSAGVQLTDLYGFDIEFDQVYTFGVVGVGREVGTNNFVPFYVQIDENGNMHNGVYYYTDPSQPPLGIRLRAMEPHPNSGHVVLGGDISYLTGHAPFLMEVDDGGNPVWNFYYIADTLFSGKGRVEDIDFDGSSWFQASGYYNNNTMPGALGFTLNFDPAGGAGTIAEYQATNIFSSGNKFYGNAWSRVLETFLHVGEYQNMAFIWNNNNTQWMVSNFRTNGTGTGCDDVIGGWSPDAPIVVDELFWLENGTQPAYYDPNITYTSMGYNFANQCVTPKRSLEEEPATEVEMAYLSAQDQIQIAIMGEVEGEWQVRVMDMSGKVVWKGSAAQRNLAISASGLNSGIYLVAYELAGGESGVQKVALLR